MFEKIIGNDSIKEILSNSIKNETLSHSYLFVGIEGVGKKLLANELVKQILNEERENHPDLISIEPDGNSIKIEQIRWLQKKIQEKPILSSKKVCIIDDAETMTTEAQNCLLKTLEEPPEYATIILIGTNESAFLATIKSRCMILRFKPIEEEKIKEYMQLNYKMNDITKEYLSMCQGSIGKAIALKDKQNQYTEIIQIIENLEKKDLIEIIKLSKILYSSKEEIYEILEYMNILLLEKAKENSLYTNCIQIVENTKKRLNQNANYDMCIDNMLFNMWEEIN